jgi:hypothetical protein
MYIGHLGVGWYGVTPMPFPAGENVPTNVVGLRYWATPMIGIDGALGFAISSGSVTQPSGMMFDTNSRTVFLFHAGVPLALANAGHFSFQVTPEVDIGFGSGTNPMPPGTPNQDLNSFLLKVGARAGAELQFGFIGVPQLAIDASLGIALTTTSNKVTTGATSAKASNLTIATSDVFQPWNIFREDVSVRYYF